MAVINVGGGTSLFVVIGIVMFIVALAYIIYSIYNTIYYVFINHNSSSIAFTSRKYHS